MLKLPFPSCAFLFDDPRTLEIVQSLLSRTRTTRATGYRMLTVYVFSIPRDLGETGLRFVFLADAYDGEWPYLVMREVPLDGKRNLDEILQSHPEPDQPDAPADAFFDCEEMRALLHLAINAVLYATSSDFVPQVRRPPPRPSLGIRKEPLELSGETVFYLPNRIVVGPPQGSSDIPSGTTGRQIHKRFWVRGHWRKPNADWRDQRLRWIAPYLKGPEMTVIVERAYDLKGQKRPTDTTAPSSS